MARFNRGRRTLLWAMLGMALLPLSTSAPLQGAPHILPEMGTAGVSALPIAQEMRYGKAFMQLARASLPIIDDPVLNHYLSELTQQLLSHADGVLFPFEVFLVKDAEINAAAFLGGRLKIHSGLFLYADDESELASVIAHEITHVTQRHIARYMEAQAQGSALTLAGVVGSIALAIANPSAGLAALQTTLGLSAQAAINYTRDNEFEADRLGMQLLHDAGFDARAMARFFQKLAAQYRYATTPPAMLLTHPLPETRISEARARAEGFTAQGQESRDFALAKARIKARYSELAAQEVVEFYTAELNDARSDSARLGARYGLALGALALKNYAAADTQLQLLAKALPDNLFVLDAQTDLDVAKKAYAAASARLTQRLRELPNNEVVVMNLASTQLAAGNLQASIALLDPYLRQHTTSLIGWQLIAEAYGKAGQISELHSARCEQFALRGQYKKALGELTIARASTSNRLAQARLDARKVELTRAQAAFDELKK
ncbi:MAG: M48 family metalloprotease [Aeromonas sp.]